MCYGIRSSGENFLAEDFLIILFHLIAARQRPVKQILKRQHEKS
jgi:hypothetical protein